MTAMLPEAVNRSMRALCESLQDRMPDTVESVYVYGSAALHAYIEGSSDIDFIVFVNRALTSSDIRLIAQAHEDIEPALLGIDIMGAYIRAEDAGKPAHELLPVPAYFDKRLRLDGTGDLNPVTWWMLKKRGICVYGRDLSFRYEITPDELVRYVMDNMNAYWTGWMDRLEQKLHSIGAAEPDLPLEQLDFAVEWCTLGMLRQWYTVREREVTSKIGAGSYGLARLPERWHGLIREAIAIKRRERTREYESQAKRLHDLVGLLRLIHEESNRFAQKS
ncbi:aminoglycoside adenylyltransferase domain-containing protein [Paenibacillus arenilitoris]|uniref:DUF4111 domain-containing protein n=1 Tax=Paenibacillus arenilitoris TaxID=2772299 RepID=A0A927CIF6_9BACL|nr:aminoglycoside adenylyltransferase domain-containing protein [Paenibacillus arenilitoris]MBD2868693.1 DUF4111 domain-containing protein [Paenibacillus arenilitoris]